MNRKITAEDGGEVRKMRLFDYISALTDKKVLIECYDRFDTKEFFGRAEDMPPRLWEKLIIGHNVYIDHKSRIPVMVLILA